MLESLESRQLLAGVTLITHGRDGHLWGFNDLAAAAVMNRVGGPSQAAQYILTLTPATSDGHLVPALTHKDGTAFANTAASGEIVLEVDYTSVDKNTDYHLDYIASVIGDYFRNTPIDGVKLAELPLHEISLSRGTGLCDEIAKNLGRTGIWVDQESYADPNPVEVMGDASPIVYDNVAFVDNYWRWDGNPNNSSTNGAPVAGAYNLNTQWLDSHYDGWPLIHLTPSGYYLGTIDLNATWGGEGPIYSDWYGNTPDKPARDQTGYLYSRILGGQRPLSGVWAPSGGTGSRTATGTTGQQWANVTDVKAANGSVFTTGQTLQVSYLHQDRDSNNTVSFYLDRDGNPYNGAFAASLGSAAFGAAASPASATFSAALSGLASGSYNIATRISDDQGHTRFYYGKPITIIGANNYLSDLTPASQSNGWGPFERDRSNGEQGSGDGKSIILNGTSYAKGIGIHANSDITYNLNRAFAQFITDVGVDDEVGNNGSVVFQVYLDGIKAFDSGTMTGATATKAVNLNVANASTLRLVVTDAGNGNTYDHADWAGARLTANTSSNPAPPAAPTGLSADYNSGTGKIDLSWSDSANDLTGFRIERKLGAGGTYAAVTTVSGSTFSYSDAGPFAASSTYVYRVIATNAGGDSQPSAEQSATTPGAQPPGDDITFLSDLSPTSSTSGWGPVELNMSNGEQGAGDGRLITLNNTSYGKGLGVHADSTIVYNLNGQYAQFFSDVGVDDEVGNNGSVNFQVYLDNVLAYDSGRMTGTSATKAITLDVSGKNQLKLVVTNSGDGATFDHADWANARVTGGTSTPPPTGTPAYLSDLTPTAQTNGWGNYEKDRSNGEMGATDGRTLTLNGATYVKGIGVHAASDISFNLAGGYTSFTSDIGVDDEVGTSGSVVFQVYVDGSLKYTSQTLSGSSATQQVSIPLSGANILRLVVTDAGNGNAFDHADWANARIT
jgi:hypothetical protein